MYGVERTDVIESTINIEHILCTLINIHFFPGGCNLSFAQKVLYDESLTSNFKRELFFKCYPNLKKQLDEPIRKAFKIRNRFAHFGFLFSETLEDEPVLRDPKDLDKPVNMEELRADFHETASKIEAALGELLKQVMPLADQ